MKVIEENGRKYLVFEAGDEKAREAFEDAVSSREAVSDLMAALAEAAATMSRNCRCAWEQIKAEAWRGGMTESPDMRLTYEWISRRFLLSVKETT